MNVPKTAAAAVFVAIAVASVMTMSRPGLAANDNNQTQDEKLKIQIGARIAPVHLTIGKKDADTVYLGSYLVNASNGCNDCHTNPSYAPGGDPFLNQPKQINKDHYLGGGASFGPFVTSRNITPNASGKPAGLSYSDFVLVLKTGIDFDHVHGPNVTLQVMPWPVYGNLTDREMNAIYTYLSAIPCLEGDPGVPAPATPASRCAI